MADLDAIKDKISLPDIVREAIKLRRSGNEWTGKCPFHEDKSNSLSVGEKLFNCHAASCGKNGSILDWLMLTHNVDLAEAIKMAEKLAGMVSAHKAEPAKRTMPMGLAEQRHADLTPQRRAYYHGRGLTDETIDYFKLGWDGTHYTIPVIVGSELLNIRRRRDDANKKDKGEKYLNTAGYGTAVLFNQDCLRGAESVIVTEGEFDAMLLAQHGWKAVCSTGGAGTFKAEWVPLFADCRTVYICYDNDLAGRSGTAKVAALLGDRARLVTLPEEVDAAGDLTDFFVKLGRTDADLEELLQQARPYEPPQVAEADPAKAVHLAQSAHSDLVGKKVEVKVLIAGKLDAPYIVPRKVRYSCYASEREREICGAADDERADGYWDKTFNDQEPTFIELCHKRTEQLQRVLKAAAGCQANCKKFNCQPLEYANIEEILAVPMADRVLPTMTSNGHKEIDETGNEYVARNVYLLDSRGTVNQYYQIVGRVFPHPNTQLGTILVADANPMQDNIAQFQITDEIRMAFRVFQPSNHLVEHIQTLLDDLTNNVTRIYKRDEALLAILLGYHSVLNFVFEGRPIRRGWLEVLLLGDTGLGKTELIRSLIDFCGLGILVSGETTTRTGLTYAIEQVGERWFVKWGKYPLADRRLLAIDELSELPEDDLGKMTQGRNDGILRVDRAGVGETNCRTRLIWLSNPRWKKGLYDFSHGVEALKTLFPTPADLRRLDLAVFLAKKDIDLDEINRVHAAPAQQLITADLLKQSILWAWSRKCEDVEIGKATTEKILDEASRLSKIYGAAEDISLVSPADMRNKLARMAVALAALVHSTDETHERVIVEPIHIQFIGAYLDSVYRAPNCRYDVYAGYAAKKSELEDYEVSDITKELRALDVTLTDDGKSSTITDEILGLYRQHDVLTASEIADLVDIDRRTATKRLKILQRHGLITKTKHGYHKTPKFVEYLSRL